MQQRGAKNALRPKFNDTSFIRTQVCCNLISVQDVLQRRANRCSLPYKNSHLISKLRFVLKKTNSLNLYVAESRVKAAQSAYMNQREAKNPLNLEYRSNVPVPGLFEWDKEGRCAHSICLKQREEQSVHSICLKQIGGATTKAMCIEGERCASSNFMQQRGSN